MKVILIGITVFFFLVSCSVNRGLSLAEIVGLDNSSVLKSMSENLSENLSGVDSASLKTTGFTLTSEQIDTMTLSAEEAVKKASLQSSEDFILVMPVYLGAIVEEIGKLSNKPSSEVLGMVAVVSETMVKETGINAATLSSFAKDSDKSTIETALDRIPATIFENANKLLSDKSEVAGLSEVVIQSVVKNLGEAGLNDSELQSALRVCSGSAVKALDNISVDGFSEANLAEVIESIGQGATKGLGEISLEGIDESDLPAMMNSVVSSMVSNLDEIKIEGFNAADLPVMVEKITFGTAAALDEIQMIGYDGDDISSMLQTISGAATAALDNIVMDEYDSSDFDEMVETITKGATSGVNEIAMADFTVDDFNVAFNAISAGVSSSFDDIEGVEDAVIDEMTAGISRGAATGLSDIQNYEFDSVQMMGEFAEGTAFGFQDLSDNFTFDQSSIESWFENGVNDVVEFAGADFSSGIGSGYTADAAEFPIGFYDEGDFTDEIIATPNPTPTPFPEPQDPVAEPTPTPDSSAGPEPEPVTIPEIRLQDSNSLSETNTNQLVLMLTVINDFDADGWCLLEQGKESAPPASPIADDDCFQDHRPIVAQLSAAGLRTVYLFIKNSEGVVSITPASATIEYSLVAPDDPTLALAATAGGSNLTTESELVITIINSSPDAARWCLSELQSSAPLLGTDTCSGGTGPNNGWHTNIPSVFQLSPSEGAKTVFLWTANEANNVSVGVVSQNIDLVFPTAPDNPIIGVVDMVTGSSTHANQNGVNIDIGNDNGVVKWCVSETQTNAPLSGSDVCTGGQGPSNGWLSVEPISFTLSAGDGEKHIYFWVASASDEVNSSPVFYSLTLDTTAPATAAVSLADPNTGSDINAEQSTVNLLISADSDALFWCVMEQDAALAVPLTPFFDDSCFVGSRPSTVTLTAVGARSVYVFTKDVAENVSAVPGSAAISFTP